MPQREMTLKEFVETLHVSHRARREFRAMKETLNFYSEPESYEEMQLMGEMRPPGVLVDNGKRARDILTQIEEK